MLSCSDNTCKNDSLIGIWRSEKYPQITINKMNNIQVEYDSIQNIRVEFKVEWLNDCQYYLIHEELDTLKVTILSMKHNCFEVEISSLKEDNLIIISKYCKISK
jgi:hypothetical protein